MASRSRHIRRAPPPTSTGWLALAEKSEASR